ncbi:UDP-N-acetylglucosamine1-carboxyvinyltransferase [Desulfarculus baarsii DSM 2075]|uniref:UDP-N-acetylglucosamine 1-carboxyvinyltransferase n=1 Tax=Desulfarculus baarsii (strain ATCC 33931 / DSM 2075 / LMG 7858 / VKM B-1802 / 2st14) TaxID=644282 RepID=E1QEX5_DESB2|nr:UDP-N-acetylglucosamine 1-carboxyvinyltransferase [Desulfarculus baarsii]ADK84111.1 UDP-N-acetylglucosamine1-carboxyvinyltransferase [Desulfarculus baarsii DSM 2075]
MDKLIIEGGRPLVGRVRVSGAKNATLPLMAACLLTGGRNRLRNVPNLRDVGTMAALLRELGAHVDERPGELTIDTARAEGDECPYELVKTMRASVLALGPMVARSGRGRVSLPGGCAIGERPIDQHLKGLEAMGCRIELEGGYVQARAKRLKGAEITFDLITVTGTENIMMAATLAQGRTVLRNAAREPEVVDLAQALNGAGARIEGAGDSIVTIDGVDGLGSIDHAVMPDRIEAGTFMMAAGVTRGELTIENAQMEHLTAVVAKLKEAGLRFQQTPKGLVVSARRAPRPVSVITGPYPGFPTDLQAQFMALMTLCNGSAVIQETIFENRLMHVPELRRLGAEIECGGNTAVVKGVRKLSGAPVMATDLRASACLVLAGLAAGGQTHISRVYHLDRGYERIDQKLINAGATVRRESEPGPGKAH